MSTGAITMNQMAIASYAVLNVMTTINAKPLNAAPLTVAGGQRELVMI